MAVSDDKAAGPQQALVAVEEPTLTDAERRLTPRELGAYQFTIRHRMAKLSPDLQARLFALFIQGTDCVEIARLNPGITLGQIVEARVEGHWDEKRQEHLESLLGETRTRLQQITMESVEFLTNQIAAAHRLHGDKIKRYLQTGNPDDLGAFSIHGFKAYREAIELLKTLSGQDAKKVSGEIKHIHESASPGIPIPAVNRAMTPDEARATIKGVLSRGGLKKK